MNNHQVAVTRRRLFDACAALRQLHPSVFGPDGKSLSSLAEPIYEAYKLLEVLRNDRQELIVALERAVDLAKDRVESPEQLIAVTRVLDRLNAEPGSQR